MLAMAARHGDLMQFLERAASRLRRPANVAGGALRFGLDLGTATIVLTAVSLGNEPVYWDYLPTRAVRDGVVIDFGAAVDAAGELIARAEAALGTSVTAAATAYPPGVAAAESRACRYVLEKAGIDCRALVDEVSAAQSLLRISDGAIADVGGGSTGVGVFRGGRLVSLSDFPGGGHYLDLILAGALGISIEAAEERKRLWQDDYYEVLRPGIERVGTLILQQIGGARAPTVHLVGGALMIAGAAATIERFTKFKTVSYPHAHLVTPFGIAVS
jgi:ethanolamine utilization protein EutJ